MRNKITACILGILCHATFVVAIGSMAYMLATGLTLGILPVGGPYGRLINILLVIQFPVLHSFFLTPIGGKLLRLPFPQEIAQELLSTTYAFVASLQVLVVFVFWTPAETVWFSPPASMLAPWLILYAASWVLLIKSLSEAGMAMHTGWLGWRAIMSGKSVVYPRIPTEGLHGQCRHPIYLSFSLIILTAPVWSFDHALLAVLWVLYCLIGPKFKERRMQKRVGAQFELIKESTPYFIPRSLGMHNDSKQSGKS